MFLHPSFRQFNYNIYERREGDVGSTEGQKLIFLLPQWFLELREEDGGLRMIPPPVIPAAAAATDGR